MAKKRSSKKTASRTTKKRASKKATTRKAQPGSLDDVKSEVALLKEVESAGRDLINTDHGSKGLFDPSVRDAVTLEKRARAVNEEQMRRAPEMAFMLYALNASGRAADKGYRTFEEYCELELEISPDKAKALARSWEIFEFLGLDANITILNRINWNKLTMLRPLLRHELLTADNVHKWLPYLEKGGQHSLLGKDLKNRVNRALDDAGITKADIKEAQEMHPKNIKLQIPTARLDEFEKYMHVLGKLDPKGSAAIGTTLLNSLATTIMTMQTDDIDGVSQQTLSVLQAKNLIEQVVPGAHMVLVAPQDDEGEYDYSNLGVVPAHRAFLTTEKKPRLVIAVDAEEACEELGVEEVVEIPLSLSSTYTAQLRAATPADVEDEDEAEEAEEEVTDIDELLDSVDDDDEEEPEEEEESESDDEEEGIVNDRVEAGRISGDDRQAVVKGIIAKFVEAGFDKSEFQHQVVQRKQELVAQYAGEDDERFLIFQDLLNYLYDEADAAGIELNEVVPA